MVNMKPELVIDKASTALVVIDLQKGIAAQPAKPYAAQDVIRNAAALAQGFRRNGMPVFLVHVVTTKETMLMVESDEYFARPAVLPPRQYHLVAEAGRAIVVSKFAGPLQRKDH